jgi:hypothetical protein
VTGQFACLPYYFKQMRKTMQKGEQMTSDRARVAWIGVFVLAFSSIAQADKLMTDVSQVKPGPVSVKLSDSSLDVYWQDSDAHHWSASFALAATQPLIHDISVDGHLVVSNAKPIYRCEVGKRRGGWDAFFDSPATHPDGTRRFQEVFQPTRVTAETIGDRVEITFDGFRMGIFSGSLRYVFYPGTSLIQQVALLSTQERDVAYYYDAGVQMDSPQDVRPGLNMETIVHFYDAYGRLSHETSSYGPEHHTLKVRYRTVAAPIGLGSIAVFPPPHRYLFARDYTTNQGYLWYSAWRGQVALGIQQYPDDNTTFDPWMNAPPGTVQEMSLFLFPSASSPVDTLAQVLAYTHNDKFPHLDGYITFSPHWHLAFTVQEMSKGPNWIPPFESMMQNVGINAAMIMDFHLEGHPTDTGNLRLSELSEYYKACRSQSNTAFLLIPSEEANVYLGGHWGLMFPHPVYWIQKRDGDTPWKTADARYGTVYHVNSPSEVWDMVRAESGYVYQTHPRTKGSTGFPDKIIDTAYFRDERYLGVGWKAMPSDLSDPALGRRAFKTVDDLNNRGLHKNLIGEVDVFQVSPTDELYGTMNMNYLRLGKLPSFDRYGEIFSSIRKGDGFISTGEVLLPSSQIVEEKGEAISVTAEVHSTFPLRVAYVVWGDGRSTYRESIRLDSSHAFEEKSYSFHIGAAHWTWARFEVWDVAGDGAFTQPVWREDRASH